VSNTIVAVLDTGLNVALAEFAGRVLPGYNFASNSVDITDDHGHGTAVTGAMAATGNNRSLGAGVDWRCRLLPVKVLGYDNTGPYSWWAQGVDFAVSNGAKIINLSAGGFGTSTTLTRAINNAIAQGVIFVTIAHNDGSVLRFPGNLPDCITVGATDDQDRRCGFSNFGPELDLVAPGTNIFTVSRNGTLQGWSGTSLAAPLTAGVCALLTSVRPDLNQKQARALLVAGAVDPVGGSEDLPGFDPYYGWGRLSALNSLLLAQTRIRSVAETNGTDLHLSWLCPSNASAKQPFQVERALSPTGPWTVVSETGQFLYSGNQCAWVDRRAATNQARWFYRIGLRGF
jgi:subtilisin family serine protease